MTLHLRQRLSYSGVIAFLLIFGCLAIAQVDGCDHCLFGSLACHRTAHPERCMYGCEQGWKGAACSERCTITQCQECVEEVSGVERCTRCYEGIYGPQCNLTCNSNCLRPTSGSIDVCDRFGHCHYGCRAPYTGSRCEEQDCPYKHCSSCKSSFNNYIYCDPCYEGYYWSQEQSICSQHCYNGTAGCYYWSQEFNICSPCSQHCYNGTADCNTFTGHCRSGHCKDGWFGDRCDRYCDVADCSRCTVSRTGHNICIECRVGQFPSADGRTCQSCDDLYCQGTCDRQTGDCHNGCLPGYYGAGKRCDRICQISHCEQCTVGHSHSKEPVCAKCREGYYVDRVSTCVECSRTCKDGKCDVYSGACMDCAEGFYGSRCQYTCSDQCVSSSCDSQLGSCVCQEGSYGDRCTRSCPEHCLSCDTFEAGVCRSCEAGFWGPQCQRHCNTNCRHSGHANYLYCDKLTGTCPNGCYDGFYGDACNATCSDNCESNICDSKNGECYLGCSIGWHGKKCDKSCPPNCVDVTVGYSRTCSQASGSCMHGCKPGFYGEFCNLTCSIRCKNHRCYEDNGKCMEGCADGYTGPDCSFTCMGDCLSQCSPNCKEESCDPDSKACVDGCSAGWYGMSCDEICSFNCADRLCDQHSGACLGECLPGLYGTTCSYRCNPNCIENNCNKKTGSCTFGCKAAFHGPDCSLPCSTFCPNSTCHQDNGECTRCGIGKRGPFCEQDCLPGFYGVNCEESCGHCKDYSPCYGEDGRCPSGCEAGFTGYNCRQDAEDVYKDGWYPFGCEVGFTGYNCRQALAQYSRESETSPSRGVQIAIGCSVGGVFCVVMIFAALLWVRRRKIWKKQKAEPAVIYSDAQVNIESVQHQPCTSLHVSQSATTTAATLTPGPGAAETGSQASNTSSIQSQSALLLGDPDSGSQIRVLQLLQRGEFYTLHRGYVNIRNQQEECCVKYVQLTDLADRSLHLKKLIKESEILSTCGSHINTINLIKTYLNTDVYCIALHSSMQTGLLPYLHRLQTGSSATTEGGFLSPAESFQILQFSIDCGSAVRHLHKLKILHRALQARHVYLSSTLVAKLGNFEWAEMIPMEMLEASEGAVELMDPLPLEFYPWQAPECFLKNDYSFSSDIWSLGLLLWEIFTLGKLPYEGLDLDTHQQAVMDGIRPSKPTLAHFTLYRVMKSCWRYDVEDRPSADNLLQQLVDIQGRYANVENILVHV